VVKISNIKLLLNYIEIGGNKEFEALLKHSTSYLKFNIKQEFGDQFATWLWQKRKFVWLYQRMVDEFPDKALFSSKAESKFKGYLINLTKTFASDMHNKTKFEKNTIPDPTLTLENIPYPDSNFKNNVDVNDLPELSSAHVHFASLRILQEIRKLSLKYRIAILVVHIFPELGMIFNEEETEFIKKLSNKNIEEIVASLEELRLNKCETGLDHIYQLRVADVAELLNLNKNTLSQWLSRGRKQLAKLILLEENET